MTTLSTLKHKQWILRILIFTLVTVMIWVGFSLFRSQQRTGIPAELQKLALPLNPNINVQVIERLEQKRHYTADELKNFPIYRLVRMQNGEEEITTELPPTTGGSLGVQPTPTPSPTPQATAAPVFIPAPDVSTTSAGPAIP